MKTDSLGNRIKTIRKELNLTGIELAEKLGVSKSSISLWEGNKTQPRIDTLNKLAQLANKPISYFYEGLIDINVMLNNMKELSNLNDSLQTFINTPKDPRYEIISKAIFTFYTSNYEERKRIIEEIVRISNKHDIHSFLMALAKKYE